LKRQSTYRNNRRSRGYTSPYQLYFWVSMTITLSLMAFLLLLKLPIYLAFIAAINIVTSGFYGYDKNQAIKKGRRVPELILHYLAVIGGAAGGIAGLFLFNHKTRKTNFIIILGVSLIIHLVIFLIFYQLLLTYNWQDVSKLVDKLSTRR